MVQSLLDDDACSLPLFFLSDGEPSDARENGWTHLAVQSRICRAITDLATKHSKKIKMTMVGMAGKHHSFCTLEAIAKACNEAPGDACANYEYCSNIVRSVGKAISSCVACLTLTRTSLLSGVVDQKKYQKRISASEKQKTGIRDDWLLYQIKGHRKYDPLEKIGNGTRRSSWCTDGPRRPVSPTTTSGHEFLPFRSWSRTPCLPLQTNGSQVSLRIR